MDGENKTIKKNVETYTEDMVQAISDDKSGLVKKLIQEDEEKQKRKEEDFYRSRRNIFFTTISFLLIFLASGLIWFFVSKNKSNVLVLQEQLSPRFFADNTSALDLGGLSRDSVIKGIIDSILGLNIKSRGVGLLSISLDGGNISFERFLSILKSELNIHQTSVFSKDFSIGFLNNNLLTPKKDLFLLVRVKSFDDVFPVMKIWEQKILEDIGGLWGIARSPENAYLFESEWKNEIILNKNAKVLRDKDDKVVLFYVYLSDNDIIFADSVEAVKEISSRLFGSRLKK